MCKPSNWLIIGIVLAIYFICFIIPKTNKTKNKSEFTDEVTPKMTFEQLKKCKGFENVSESEAEDIINTLQRFTVITFKNFCHES